jgi:hypothetical protein
MRKSVKMRVKQRTGRRAENFTFMSGFIVAVLVYSISLLFYTGLFQIKLVLFQGAGRVCLNEVING